MSDPRMMLFALLTAVWLTSCITGSGGPASVPEIPKRTMASVDSLPPPPPEPEKVSILTKEVVPAVAAEIVTEEKQDINAELVDGVIVITPERDIKENRKTDDRSGVYTISRYTVTAYCPCRKCCGRGAIGLTKTETDAWKPGIAVDPRVIKLGSMIHVPGYNRAEWSIADDTGGKIKGNRIDIRFQYHWEAREWGIKHLDIKIRKAKR